MNENLVLNFGEALMREGITRTINGCLDFEPLWRLCEKRIHRTGRFTECGSAASVSFTLARNLVSHAIR